MREIFIESWGYSSEVLAGFSWRNITLGCLYGNIGGFSGSREVFIRF